MISRSANQSGDERDGRTRDRRLHLFEWASAEASKLASRHADVMEVWERMDQLTEKRGDRPKMEFPHVRPLDLLGRA